MSKTVEEILKEEGVIKPLLQEDHEKAKFEDENVDLKKVVMSIEKLQTEVETLRDFKKQNDEVTRELVEKIGEIRSLFFQRESLIKETETKVKKLEDVLSDIEPTKYLKELDKRKEEILESQAKIEKLELMEKDMNNNVSGLKQTLQNIKSVENLEKMLKEIQENVSKNRQLKDDIERTAGKTERFYLEMENRIKEFVDLKAKTDKIEDLSQELTKSVDSINIKLPAFISKTDIEDFKKSVNDIISSNREYIESKVKEIGSLLDMPSEEITSRVEQLRKRKIEVSNLLLNVEEQYRKAFISEKTYNEIKKKNEDIIKQIDGELSQIQGGQSFSLKTLPSIISNLEDKTDALNSKLVEQGKLFDESLKSMGPDSNLANVTQVVKIQTDMIDDVIKKIREMNDKISVFSSRLNSYDLRIRFFEILDGLVRLDNSKDIYYYLAEIENLISSMKASNLWDDHKESITLSLLSDIAGNWRKSGYNEIAKVFDEEIIKIKSTDYNYTLKY